MRSESRFSAWWKSRYQCKLLTRDVFYFALKSSSEKKKKKKEKNPTAYDVCVCTEKMNQG